MKYYVYKKKKCDNNKNKEMKMIKKQYNNKNYIKNAKHMTMFCKQVPSGFLCVVTRLMNKVK